MSIDTSRDIKVLHLDDPFCLESGEIIYNLDIAYHSYGTLSANKDNVVWVCHALTANSDVADWWPHTVEEGKFLDPTSNFVICANIIGSCYGTTGPLSINPSTGEPYYDNFPKFTIRDIVKAHTILADALGIFEIKMLVGSSVGGFQAIEWAAMQPERFQNITLIATAAYATPWAIAIDETQRMAILSDQTYGEKRPDAGRSGLAAARAIGLLTYRGGKGYNITQQDIEDAESDDSAPSYHRACSYQRYQGEKLCRRYNAYSYMSILDAFDTHNVGRGRGGIKNALNRIKCPVLVIGITTDMIFPPEEMRELASMIPNAKYAEISSAFGHDGFLVEHDQLNVLINKFLGRNLNGKD